IRSAPRDSSAHGTSFSSAAASTAATCPPSTTFSTHHINVNADKQEALADSKKFLDLYYSADYTKARLEAWLTYGSPRECVAHLKRFKAAGCRRITVRISTMGDPMAQFRRLVEDVLPYVD